MQNRVPAIAFVLMAGAACVAACSQPETMPRKAAHLTLDGATHTTRPPACSQDQSYRTIDLRDHDGQVEAVVLLSGYRAIPQWVKIRNIDGFTGSFWEGGVGSARADVANSVYTISGSASGINSKNPDRVVTSDFKLTAEC
ncbi:lipoprotein LpqH [Mycobacterium sp. 050134]|uniref:lipoprotein LpqH n=1 Tax=Mycobacterium sp. 050134 TaxID=3096111 RepID=UPI002ED92905